MDYVWTAHLGAVHTLAGKGDHVTDFVSGTDHFSFNHTGFAQTIVGSVSVVSGSTPVVAGKAAQFLYDTDDGTLYFDDDGTSADAKVLVVTLDGAPVLGPAGVLNA